MKKAVTISLFIFWAAVTAILAAGLIFYQNKSCPATAPVGGNTAVSRSEITLNMAELAKHNTIGDCWLLISNKIYNVTSYLSAHPGGAGTISPYCGKEATVAFQTKDIGRPHSTGATNALASYYLGDLNQTIGQQQIQNNINSTNATVPATGGEEDDD
jgi:cytochrome b involved in lipid metabolism